MYPGYTRNDKVIRRSKVGIACLDTRNLDNRLHDNRGGIHVLLDGLVRQDGTAVDVDLIADGDIVAQNGDVLETRPLANGAVPADNGRLDPGVILDTAVLEDDASLQTHSIADNDVGANGDIGTNAAVLANLR